MIRRAVGVLALAAALASPAPAQQTLERADSLASAGRAEEARSALLGWWEAQASGASRADLQRALWLRGLLTVDPSQAALDYQRLVVEYPGGPYTDGALLRLAQVERAAGRPERALAYLRALVRDYPSSPQRLRARGLIEAVEAEAERTAAAAPRPEATTRGEPAATEPARTPPADPAAERRDPAAPPASPAPGAPSSSARGEAASGAFSVQLGAFSAEGRARDLAARARSAGLDTRLVRVRGSALVRVRVGRFPGPGPAERRLAEIRSRGFDALVVADADREEEVP